MKRLLTSLLLLLAAACTTVCDVHIVGGTVIDGTGAPGRRADVLIRNGRIIAVGLPTDVDAARTIDATGLVVTPGFIDPHAHGDLRMTPGFPNFTAMGVTTICLGQDGASPGGMAFDKWLAIVDKGRTRPNIAPFVGHGTLRHAAGIGMKSDPSAAELALLYELVDKAMQQGAFGVSMGLEYEPGRFATADELAGIFRVVTRNGGLVMSHIRTEDDDTIGGALAEFCGASPEGGHAHVAHMKIVYGKGVTRAEALLADIDRHRESGRRITADVYPYVASFTGLGIVFPDWARPPNDYAAAVANRRGELAEHLHRRVTRRNGPAAMLFGSGQWEGRTLAEVAEHEGLPFADVLIALGPNGASAAYFVMDREVMERLLTADHVMVSSDGSPTMRHPRGYGAFARVIRQFVIERELLSLPAAIHKMTGLTAATVGLRDRGLIAEGMAADVLVFDPEKVVDRATFAQPYERAEGFDMVLINGVVVREQGEFTDARPGVLLRR